MPVRVHFLIGAIDDAGVEQLLDRSVHRPHAELAARLHRVFKLIELALTGKTGITVAEALAVLLQTWNAQYCQFRPFASTAFCGHRSSTAKAFGRSAAVSVSGH